MTDHNESNPFVQNMRHRWEARAQLDHRYFTASVTFDDETAWREQAAREVKMYLTDLDPAIVAEGSLLEIGCGPGRLLSGMGRHFKHAVGADISPKMLAEAQRACDGLSNVGFARVGGVGFACFAAEAFDLIMMHAVAIHLPLPIIDLYVRDAVRVLKPGGHFRFTVYRNAPETERETQTEFLADAKSKIPEGAGDLVWGPDYQGHAFTDEEIGPFVEGFGYSATRIERLGPWTFGLDLTA